VHQHRKTHGLLAQDADLITGSPSLAIVARAAEVGIEGVLEKPAGDQDLFDFINITRP
jgi:hypothetical protein